MIKRTTASQMCSPSTQILSHIQEGSVQNSGQADRGLGGQLTFSKDTSSFVETIPTKKVLESLHVSMATAAHAVSCGTEIQQQQTQLYMS